MGTGGMKQVVSDYEERATVFPVSVWCSGGTVDE
jgi:hypothetical protein